METDLLQAAIEACDAIVRLAKEDDLIWALTLRGHGKSRLNDYTVRSIADQQACCTHLLSFTRAVKGLLKHLAIGHAPVKGRMSWGSACTANSPVWRREQRRTMMSPSP